MALAAVYLPAPEHTELRDDWYDGLKLPSGQLALAVGDVAGHDIAAASLIYQLRAAVRAYVLQDANPEVVLACLDGFIEASDMDTLVTVFQALYDPGTRT